MCYAVAGADPYDKVYPGEPEYGWLAPYCKTVATARTRCREGALLAGGAFRQDKLVGTYCLNTTRVPWMCWTSSDHQ